MNSINYSSCDSASIGGNGGNRFLTRYCTEHGDKGYGGKKIGARKFEIDAVNFNFVYKAQEKDAKMIEHTLENVIFVKLKNFFIF